MEHNFSEHNIMYCSCLHDHVIMVNLRKLYLLNIEQPTVYSVKSMQQQNGAMFGISVNFGFHYFDILT